MNKGRDNSLWKGFLCSIMTHCTHCREMRERWGSETRGEKRETLNHSLGVLLLLLWFLFFSLFKRGEIRLSWNKGGRGGVRGRGGGIGIRICTLTKSRPTTTKPELCVSSLQHLSESSHPKPTTGRLLSTLYSLSSVFYLQISPNLRPPQTPLCFLLNVFSLQQNLINIQNGVK